MNQCGECTECCLVLEIKDVNSKPNELCQHCDKGVGCKIYENRPQGCREFMCMWLQMETVHLDLRPDKCGVVFEKLADDVVMGAISNEYNHNLIEGQVNSFINQGFSVLLVNHTFKQKRLFLTKGHTEEYVNEVIDGGS